MQPASLRLYTGAHLPLAPGLVADLPEEAARHAQVRRVQPGDTLWLFDGQGLDWPAQVLAMSRTRVQVQVGTPVVVALELPTAVTLALVVPANERMDSLVEKASELGVAQIQPLMAERSVLRLSGDRAERRQAHWQAVAVAACEQCGRARVPVVAPVQPLLGWLERLDGAPHTSTKLQRADTGPDTGTYTVADTGTEAHARWLLSLRPGARAVPALYPPGLLSLVTLSGPEGGFSAAEEDAAQAARFVPARLGPRVLRADTAPLAVLAWLALQSSAAPIETTR